MVTIERDATSSELRHDWLSDRWVIMAPQRTARPFDFVRHETSEVDPSDCPFCAGNEHLTPDAVLSYGPGGEDSDDNWAVRVVPNKFPAVTECYPDPGFGVPSESAATEKSSINLFRRKDLTGGHEVIVESPRHLNSISQLSHAEVCLVFRAYRDRLRYWLEERGACYAVVFKNVGPEAGASLAHTHSQLIATSLLPPDVKRAADRMEQYMQAEGACLFCDLIQEEIEQKVRVVEQTPDFIAVCPFASRVPSLLTIYPTKHMAQFEQLDQDLLDQLAWLTHRSVRRIENCYPNAAYNFVIHTAPGCERHENSFHWRMELFPRLTKLAGFEWGSDCFINPLTPEEAARNLRNAGV